jgi:hypothetical protein
VKSAVIEGNTAESAEVDMEMASSSELIEPPLAAERTSESIGSISNISSFLEAFFFSESGQSFSEWFKQEIRFDGESSHSALNDDAIIIRIDSASARTHRDTELSGGARSVSQGSLSDSTSTSTQRDRRVDCIDDPLCRRA